MCDRLALQCSTGEAAEKLDGEPHGRDVGDWRCTPERNIGTLDTASSSLLFLDLR